MQTSNWNRRQRLIGVLIVAATIGYVVTTWAAATIFGTFVQGGCTRYPYMSVSSSVLCFFFWPAIELDRLGGMPTFQWLGGSAAFYALFGYSAISYLLWHQSLKRVSKQEPATPARPHAE